MYENVLEHESNNKFSNIRFQSSHTLALNLQKTVHVPKISNMLLGGHK